jgi:hypothetical protein
MRFLICIFMVLFYVQVIQTDKNRDRLFINFKEPIPCIRRFNATHQVGCGKGNQDKYTGIVYAVRNQTEFNRLTALTEEFNSYKLIIVTLPHMFPDVVDFHLQNDKNNLINGIVLIATETQSEDDEIDAYSDDLQSPNYLFSLYSKNKQYEKFDWNTKGKEFFFNNFEIPFYVITQPDDAIIPFAECYDKFNKQIFEKLDTLPDITISTTDLLCGMELGIGMSGAVSAEVCNRRSNIQHGLESNVLCDPLGGYTYYTFLSEKPSNDLPIHLITARLDSFTMFEYYTPGANEPITSLITFLSLAQLVTIYRDKITQANLLFVLFDNDAFDYGGSSRFASDLTKNIFPSIDIMNESGETKTFRLSNCLIKVVY